MKAQKCRRCRRNLSLLPDFLDEEKEKGEAVSGMVIEEVVGLAVFVFISWRNTSCFLSVLVTVGNMTNIIGSIMRVIVRMDARIIIVKIIIKPKSNKQEKK